uniref:Uncharacterized protein n=1 Tax=Oryza meridionalis TaxID=40149 RepID=A0A0E0BZ41_9ORYZ
MREDAGLARPSSSAQEASPIRGKKAESEALGLPPCAATIVQATKAAMMARILSKIHTILSQSLFLLTPPLAVDTCALMSSL